MKRIFKYLPAILIISFWSVMMAALLINEYKAKDAPFNKVGFPHELPFEKIWGIYVDNIRIGSLESSIKKEDEQYVWQNKADIRTANNTTFLTIGTALFNSSKNLISFWLKILYNDYEIRFDGKVKGNQFELSLKDKQGQINYVLSWDHNTNIMNNGFIPMLFAKGLNVGDKLNWYILNPITHAKELIKGNVKRATLFYNKNDFVPVIILNVYYQDINLEFWIDEKGNPVKVQTPWGWDLISE